MPEHPVTVPPDSAPARRPARAAADAPDAAGSGWRPARSGRARARSGGTRARSGGTAPADPGSAGSGESGGEPRKVDLTVNKVIAGAGAAATSAVLGSFFGAMGTVTGAAVGSIASTVVTSFYEHSLNRTQDTVAARLRRRRSATETAAAAGATAAAADVPPCRCRGSIGRSPDRRSRPR